MFRQTDISNSYTIYATTTYSTFKNWIISGHLYCRHMRVCIEGHVDEDVITLFMCPGGGIQEDDS